MCNFFTFSFIFKNNFLEKNINTVPKAINDICQNLHMNMNGTNIVQNKSYGKSTTSLLKTGTDHLISKLDETVSKLDRVGNLLHQTPLHDK